MTQPADCGSTTFSIGSWVFSPAHGETFRILEVESVWDHIVCQVWVPGKGTVERLAVGSLAVQGPPRKSGLDRLCLCRGRRPHRRCLDPGRVASPARSRRDPSAARAARKPLPRSELGGDEIGFLVSKVAEIKRQK